MLLKVLYEAWKQSDPFKRLVLEEIYTAANLDRPFEVSEIQMIDMTMEGDAPQLENVKLCTYDEYMSVGADPDLDCYVEADIIFEG